MKRWITGIGMGLWLVLTLAQSSAPGNCQCTSPGKQQVVHQCLADGTGCSIAITLDASTNTCELPYCVLCVRRASGKARTVTWTLTGDNANFHPALGINIADGSDFTLPGQQEPGRQSFTWVATITNSPHPRPHQAQIFPHPGTSMCTSSVAHIVNTDQ